MSSHIHPSAQVGADTTYGENCVIGEGVEIGAGCRLGHGVIVHDGTRIGANVRIDDYAVIGKRPMRAANSAVTREQELPPAEIGEGAIIGTHATVYRGATLGPRVLAADLATIRERVQIGEATIIGRGATVENDCTVGAFCKLETNVYLTAYSTVEDRVFIAPCVATSNDNFVGRTRERFKHFKGLVARRGARIGVGAVILPGREVGADAQIGAGSVVTRDAPSGQVSVGAPARITRPVVPEQLLDHQES